MREAIDFNRKISEYKADPTVRSKAVTAAIALALAHNAPLPSSPVDDLQFQYNTAVAPAGREGISMFNENTLVDTELCLRWLRAFWLIRYSAAHPHPRAYNRPGTTFASALFSVPEYLSKDDETFLNENTDIVLTFADYALGSYLNMIR